MNAFKYSNNEEAPKQELRVPMIMLSAISGEGYKRVEQVAEVLSAHSLSFDKYNNLKIKH